MNCESGPNVPFSISLQLSWATPGTPLRQFAGVHSLDNQTKLRRREIEALVRLQIVPHWSSVGEASHFDQ